MGIAILTSTNATWPWSTTGGQTTITAELLGAGGGGGGVTNNTEGAGGGGAGGEYVRVTITKGAETTLNITVGTAGTNGTSGDGGSGGYSEINQNGTVVARAPGGEGGKGGADNTSYAGGAGINGVAVYTGGSYYTGGDGAAGNITSNYSGGGGGSGGPGGDGGTTTDNTAGTRGTGTWADGSTTRNTAGAAGRTTGGVGASASDYGGGGAGGYATTSTNRNGGTGGAGIVVLTWNDVAAPSDTITTVTDVVTAVTGAFAVGPVSDSVTATDWVEGATAVVGGTPISKDAGAETATATDVLVGTSRSSPILVTDVVTAVRGAYSPTAFSDSVSVTDTATVSGAVAPAALAETVTVTDAIPAVAGAILPTVADQVTTTDAITAVSGASAPATVADSVTVTDAVTGTDVQTVGAPSATPSDTVAATDAVIATGQATPIVVTDVVVDAQLVTVGGPPTAQATDTVTVSDVVVQAVLEPLRALVTDTVTVSDSAVSGRYTLVGDGYTDGSMRQIVRTTAGVAYAAVITCNDYPDLASDGLAQRLHVYKSNDAGVPPASFTVKDGTNEPTAAQCVAAALDASDTLHVAWLERDSWSGEFQGHIASLRYATFSTATDTWGTKTTIVSTLDYVDGGQGDEGVALAVDANGKVHIAFLSTNDSGVLSDRRIYYTHNVSGSWAAQTQVDTDLTYASGFKAWHPGICFDTAGRLVLSWLKGTDNNDGSTDGTIHVRTRETSGTWNTAVQVASGLYCGIDQCVSLLVTNENRYHVGYSSAKSGAWSKVRYQYSDTAGQSWTTNHPTDTDCHNVTVGPGAPGQVRLWMHGPAGSGVDVRYFEGAGGSASWGSQQIFAAGTFDAECSLNARWSQYHHAFPSTVDVAWWDAVYTGAGNQLYWGSQRFGSDSSATDTVTVTDAITAVRGASAPADVPDSATVTDAITAVAGAYAPAIVADAVTVTDWATGAVGLGPPLTQTASDLLTVADAVADVRGASAPTAFSDSVTATDAVSDVRGAYAPTAVSDSVTVTDDVQPAMGTPGGLSQSATEAVTVSDVVTAVSGAVTVTVVDQVTVSDSATGLPSTPGAAEALVWDDVTVTDQVEVRGTFSPASLSETVTVTDVVTEVTGALQVTVADTVTLSDTATGLPSTPGVAEALTWEDVTVTDAVIQAVLEPLRMSGTDTITVTDVTVVTGAITPVAFAETVTLSDSVAVTGAVAPTTLAESVTVSDVVVQAKLEPLRALLVETATVTDVASAGTDRYDVETSDAVTVTDTATGVVLGTVVAEKTWVVPAAATWRIDAIATWEIPAIKTWRSAWPSL